MSPDIVYHINNDLRRQALYLGCLLQGRSDPLDCVLWVYTYTQGQEQRDGERMVPCMSAAGILCQFHLYDGHHGRI